MIAVVADDFSGAAEIAGATFARGLNAEVHTRFDPSSSADLISLDANTRSLPADEAAGHVASFCEIVEKSRPDWLFMKVDSVLRGPVLAEIVAAMEATSKQRALLAPANPSLGRVIREGHYLVQGTPLDQTEFARDPSYPAQTSRVLDLLATCQNQSVYSVRVGQELPDRGIAVVDAESHADLRHWAACVDGQTLPVGAAAFFEAVLSARCGLPAAGETRHQTLSPSCGKTLLLCGSLAAWPTRQRQCADLQVPAVVAPAEFFEKSLSDGEKDKFANSAYRVFETHDRVMIAIGGHRPAVSIPPDELVERLAEVTCLLLENCPVGQLLVEGGATAAAIVRRMTWGRFQVRQTLAAGCVGLDVAAHHAPRLWVKPGSYDWPEAVWRM